MKNILLLTLIALLAFVNKSQAQEPMRLTGVVLNAENRQALPYVTIRIVGTMHGTATDNNGYFSLLINPGDTLHFTSIGFKQGSFIMPYGLESNQYSLVQLLVTETKILKEVEVFPWPTMANFKRAFLDTKPDMEKEDMIREVQRDVREDMKKNAQYEYYYDQMRYNKLYQLHGEIPPNNFLNPIRWSNFIRDLEEGRVSNRKKNE